MVLKIQFRNLSLNSSSKLVQEFEEKKSQRCLTYRSFMFKGRLQPFFIAQCFTVSNRTHAHSPNFSKVGRLSWQWHPLCIGDVGCILQVGRMMSLQAGGLLAAQGWSCSGPWIQDDARLKLPLQSKDTGALGH